MNRAERRRNARQEKPRTYVLTEDQIKKMKSEATEQAFKMLLSMPVVVLHDKFGFDEVQLDEFIHYCTGWADGVQCGDVSLREILQICRDEAGIQIIDEEDKR